MAESSEENSSNENKMKEKVKLCVVCKKDMSKLVEKQKRNFSRCKECRPKRRVLEGNYIDRKCSYCGIIFKALYYSKKALVNTDKKRKCDECKKSKIPRGPLPRPKAPFVQCDLCGSKFKKKIHIYAHMDKHRSDVTCRVCNAQFTCRNTLRIHLRTHFEKFICELCGYSTTNKSTFRKHVKQHENIDIDLPIQNPNGKKEYKYPAVRGNFPCKYCGLNFNTKTSLTGHEKRRHESGQKGFSCKYCEFNVFRQKEFREHLMTHSSKPLLFCHYSNCDFYHNTVKRLNMHIRAVHESKEDSYQCHTCNKLFKHRISLEKHLQYNRCVPLNQRKLKAAKKNISKSTKLIENKTAEELEMIAKIAKQQYLEIRGLNKIIANENEEHENVENNFKNENNDEYEEEIKLKTETQSDDDDNRSMNNYSLSEQFDNNQKSGDEMENVKDQLFVKVEIKSEPIDNDDIIMTEEITENVPDMYKSLKPELLECNLSPIVLLERLDTSLLLKKEIKQETDSFDEIGNNSCNKSQKKRKRNSRRIYYCKYCPETFSRKLCLNQHEKNSHELEIQNKIFICDFCGKQFDKYNAIKIHIQFVHLQKTLDFLCPHCPAKYKHKNFLKRHVEEAHEKTKEFCCQYCGKKFKRKSQLKDHEVRHGDPVPCHICGKMVKSLETHLKAVHVEKKEQELFSCPFCERQFNKYVLKSHIKIVHHKVHYNHTVDRPCDKCGQIFTRREDLKRHELMTHFEGAIKYCPYEGCDKMFKTIKRLNMHTREVHEKKEEVSCEVCGKILQSVKGLIRHAKNKHNMDI